MRELTLNVGESFSPVPSESRAYHPRRPGEADFFQVAQQGVNSGSPWACGPEDYFSAPLDASAAGASRLQYDLFVTGSHLGILAWEN